MNKKMATLMSVLLFCFTYNPLLVVGREVVVSQDGSGDYVRIMDAVLSAPNKSSEWFTVHIKKGIYQEYIVIPKHKYNVRFIGDGMDSTIITGNRSVKGNPTLETFATATFTVSGAGFVAQNLTIQNTAGPMFRQAVALMTDADMSVYYHVQILAYQDSLYIHSNRALFRECKIGGTVDFVFGRGTAVFQNCTLVVRKGLPEQYNTIAAHGPKVPENKTGFSFQFCTVIPDEGLIASPSKASYLGRPWNTYAVTVFMQSFLSPIIKAEGWIGWNGSEKADTVYHGEYLNNGPGANTNRRVAWPGYHKMSKDEAEKFTVKNLIEGDTWIPQTGIVYYSGLEILFALCVATTGISQASSLAPDSIKAKNCIASVFAILNRN